MIDQYAEDIIQSAEERRRLIDRLGSESITPLGAVLKCAAGIFVLVIIAAGPWAFLSAGGPTAANERYPAPKANAAMTESNRFFDERRKSHEAVQDDVADASNAMQRWPAVE